jgi:hypothetical protein
MRARVAGAFAVAVALLAPSGAQAADPGRWLMTGVSSVPTTYWQGLSADSQRRLFFSGVFEGLWRTTPRLRQTAGLAQGIPAAVKAAEGYNHVGDPSFDRRGARLLLPLECYNPGSGGNTCGTGAFGVADAELRWQYYVQLDPAEIAKAMWAEISPDGKLIWTSSRQDLLAYRASDVTPANAGPAGPLIHPVVRLAGAVPPTGITGAAFTGGRLLLAGYENGAHQVWAVDTASGARRLELELRIIGESEGLAVVPTLGGELHYLIAPADPRGPATYGPASALLHFVPRPGRPRLTVRLLEVRQSEGRVKLSVCVARMAAAYVPAKARRRGCAPRALPGARVGFAGDRARTDRGGRATLSAPFARGGEFRVLATSGRKYGLSGWVEVEQPALPG